MRERSRAGFALLVWAAFIGMTVGSGAQAPQPGGVVQTPELMHRPVAVPPKEESGNLQLNVVVTDKARNPEAGLTQQDFTVLDNGQARPILSFHAYSGGMHADGPPVETIILLDMLNTDPLDMGQSLVAIEKYLRENGGHLAGATSVYILSANRIQGEAATMDGNALADSMDELAKRNRSSVHENGAGGMSGHELVSLSLRALGMMAQNEAQQPGRKLLIWVGPGWPLGEGLNDSQEDANREFVTIENFSTQMREAQIALYNVSLGTLRPFSHEYQDYVKGVKSPKDARSSDLSLKVIATQSGGLVLGPDQNLARQIGICQQDASAYYTITFDPTRPDRRDEFHDIQVQTDKPDLKARTTNGYYYEP